MYIHRAVNSHNEINQLSLSMLVGVDSQVYTRHHGVLVQQQQQHTDVHYVQRDIGSKCMYIGLMTVPTFCLIDAATGRLTFLHRHTGWR